MLSNKWENKQDGDTYFVWVEMSARFCAVWTDVAQFVDVESVLSRSESSNFASYFYSFLCLYKHYGACNVGYTLWVEYVYSCLLLRKKHVINLRTMIVKTPPN